MVTRCPGSIIIATASALLQRSLVTFVREDPNISLIGLNNDPSQLWAAIQNIQPQVLLLDAELLKEDLFSFLTQLRAQYPELNSIVLCDSPSQQILCLQEGGTHALLKGFLADNLRGAISAGPV